LRSLKNSGATDVYLVPFLPYQTPALAAWKTALKDNGSRVRQIKEPVIGQKRFGCYDFAPQKGLG
jgi:hypothetical protein